MKKRFLKPPKNFELGDNSRRSHENKRPFGNGSVRSRGETLGRFLEKSRPKPRKNSEPGDHSRRSHEKKRPFGEGSVRSRGESTDLIWIRAQPRRKSAMGDDSRRSHEKNVPLGMVRRAAVEHSQCSHPSLRAVRKLPLHFSGNTKKGFTPARGYGILRTEQKRKPSVLPEAVLPGAPCGGGSDCRGRLAPGYGGKYDR